MNLLDSDPNAVSRKQDHISLAFQSQIANAAIDPRFSYEPLLAAHPTNKTLETVFLGKKMQVPIWVSSMTGGTKWAKTINQNLARACAEFGMGMGLGSCRQLLYSDEHFTDFDVRQLMGDQPLYANLGVAQLELLLKENKIHLAKELVKKLQADGLIIHVNPFQEWLQPEGDRFEQPAIQTVREVLEKTDLKIIVKEVGQGMGKESLRVLFELPLEAVDFAASGGTNFALIELFRSEPLIQESYQNLAKIGHSAEEMVRLTNELKTEMGTKMLCRQVIISGGVRNFLDGYYLSSLLQIPSIYGQASAFLKHAQADYAELQRYTELQIRGLALAKAFLRVKE